MKSDRRITAVNQQYLKLLSLHEQTLKYVQAIGADPELVQTYKAVLHFLRTRTHDQIEVMLAPRSIVKNRTVDSNNSDLSDTVIEQFTLEQVGEWIFKKSAPRKLLERIAAVRFGVTRGAMSGLKSRDALIEKLLTLIRNEGTHGSIARAAVRRVGDGP